MGKPNRLLRAVTPWGDLCEWEPAEVKHLSKRWKRKKYQPLVQGFGSAGYGRSETYPGLLAKIPLVVASERGIAQTYSVV